jgi:hypothetical protein
MAREKAMRELFEDRRFWTGLLITGLLLHILAAEVMPIGLDAHLHATYVTDGMDDGEPSLEWGPVRTGDPNGSVPSEVDSNGRWSSWHLWMEGWFTAFGKSTDTLHQMGLTTGFAALAAVYLCTRRLWGAENALRLTALASIHPPLIRAAGRCYQEGAVLLVITLCFTALVLGERQRKAGRSPLWWAGTILAIGLLLDLKGLPLEGMWVAALLLGLWPILEPRVQPLAPEQRISLILVLSLIVMTTVLSRNGIDMADNLGGMLGAWLLAVLLVGFIFVFAGMGLFARREVNLEGEAAMLRNAGLLGLGVITGYVAALWVTEAVALDLDLGEVWYSFRHNPRYASLLIVPLWWAWMAHDDGPSIIPDRGREILFASAIVLMLLLNAFILGHAGERRMEDIGTVLGEQIEDDGQFIYVAPATHAMHRLYTIHLTLDPDNDRNLIGHWRSPDSDWREELQDCSRLGAVDWILIDPYADVDDDWGSGHIWELEGGERWTLQPNRNDCPD